MAHGRACHRRRTVITETTQTGVSTRVLEIYGGPFADEKSASLMHQQAGSNCGWAGPEFIKRVMGTDERTITDHYDRMVEEVYRVANGTSGSHIAGISAVALADAMIETWIFSGKSEQNVSENGKQELVIAPEVWQRSVQMAHSIIQEQLAAGVADVNENAVQYIVDWILSNRQYFGEKAIGTCLGTISADQGKAYIFPSILNNALSKAGYSPRKTLKYMADNNIISSKSQANGSRVYSITKWFDNRTCRFVEFDLKRYSKPIDPLDEDEAAAAQGQQQESEFRQLNLGETTPFDNKEQAEELPY